MLCKICSNKTEKLFETVILGKYTGSYYQCPSCQFLQVSNPFWLKEAYSEPINLSDTGILARNFELRKLAATVIYYFFNHKGNFVDFAGGYGIFTRLMRDTGFNFFWSDKYTSNVFAKGFEFDFNQDIEVLTAFEVLEHFEDPLQEISNMLAITKNLLFTTELLPTPSPAPGSWWYYGTEHGQHISFYTKQTLQYIASRFGLRYFNYRNVHLFTNKPVHQLLFELTLRYRDKLNLFNKIEKKMTSKTHPDMEYIIETQNVQDRITN